MFFKKGLRDLSLIHKLTMKNPRTSEEMLAITNRYALAKEVTLDTRDQKKDKELGYSDQPSTSKSNDKKRKADRFKANCWGPVPWLPQVTDYSPKIYIRLDSLQRVIPGFYAKTKYSSYA
jgi:hypothetical protein